MTQKYSKDNNYTVKDFDKNFCLKIDFGMLSAFLFLMRPYVLALSSMNTKDLHTHESYSFVRQLVYPDFLTTLLGIIATIPAIVFAIAWIKREPNASTFIRKIWHKSALLLNTSAVMNIIIVFIPFIYDVAYSIRLVDWIQIGISLLIIQYLSTSDRVKDTFKDFPSDPSKSKQFDDVSQK